jgi:cytochrome c oxidase subunit III
MNITTTQNRSTLHPQLLMMYIGMASMFMVFAGFTSAFILQNGSAHWTNIKLPISFTISTVAIIASSFTMHKMLGAFKANEKGKYKTYALFTLILGLAFILLQALSFANMVKGGIYLDGSASGAFLYVIAGAHGLHVIAAIITLVIVYITAFLKDFDNTKIIGHQLLAAFWHFLDILWIYLFLFFILNFKF